MLVDSMGLLLAVMVTASSADDGTAAPGVLGRLTPEHRSRLEVVRGDAKYRNHSLDDWLIESGACYRVEVVARPPGSTGFVKVPKRWVVERTFAWIGRWRRNSRDHEFFEHSSEAIVMVGSIHRMLKLLKPDRSNPPAPFKIP